MGALDGYERVVLEEFGRAVGADVAVYLRPEGPGSAAGLRRRDADWRQMLADRSSVYECELAGFVERTMHVGVGVDEEYLGPALRRTAYYREMVETEGGRATLYGVLVVGGDHVGTVGLGRRRRGFRAREKRAVLAALPALAVCEMAMRGRGLAACRVDATALTAREREVLDYLRLGYDNRQIALALGRSPNTIRNQLSSAYAKLGASNRVEALARVFGLA